MNVNELEDVLKLMQKYNVDLLEMENGTKIAMKNSLLGTARGEKTKLEKKLEKMGNAPIMATDNMDDVQKYLFATQSHLHEVEKMEVIGHATNRNEDVE